MGANSDSSSQPFWRNLGVVLAPTLVIGFISYVYTTLDTRRRERLEFVRGQIVKLYGPLYTLSETTEDVWKNLGKNRKPDFNQHPPDIDKIILWRNLLHNVVLPLNTRIENTLLTSGETIRCPDARKELLQFFSFAESVKLVVAGWKSEDDVRDKIMQSEDRNMPGVSYPTKLSHILCVELYALHQREKKLDDGFWGLLLPDIANDSDCAPPPPSDSECSTTP
jgi:hypothetical protein